MVYLTRRLAPRGFKSLKPKIKSSKNLSIVNATALTEKMSALLNQGMISLNFQRFINVFKA
ncbi:Mobile element protein [Richelia intracellularis]|nr:Mobile element protein [Richelia intracellularis]